MAQQAEFFSIFTDVDADTALSLTRASQSAKQYDDMCKFVNTLVKKRCSAGQILNQEEQSLLSIAYKSVISSKRNAWRALNNGYYPVDCHKKYQTYVLGQLRAKCNDILVLLHDYLLPPQRELRNEDAAFYLKMCGDYHRYLAELDDGNQRENAIRSKCEYEEAYGICLETLHPTHPTRLGTALNLAVCYYEILHEGERARTLCDRAFKAALNKWDEIEPNYMSEATPILKLLRDNFTCWTEQMTSVLGKANNAE